MREGYVRAGIGLVVGGLLVLLGLYAIGRHDAACVIEASHPALRSAVDPRYVQDLSVFPLRWECVWPQLDGAPMTTYVNPLASVFFYGGLAVVAVALWRIVRRALGLRRAWAPPDQPDEQGEPMRMTVDGEVFDVRERPDAPGTYDFAWETAPVPPYGFSIGSNDRSRMRDDQLRTSIRDFLAQVDPETGFIED